MSKRGGKRNRAGGERRPRALNNRFDRTRDERRRAAAGGSYLSGYQSRLNGGRSRKAQATAETAHNTPTSRVEVAEALRESDRQNGVFKRCLNVLVENAVGQGYTVVPATADDGWNKAAREIWEERTKRENFTPNQLLNEWRCHQLVCRHHQRDGEILVYHPHGKTQLFEGPQIVTPYSERGNAREGFVFSDADGSWKGVWVGPYSKYGFVDSRDAQFLPAWHYDSRYDIRLPVLNYIHHSDFVSGLRGMSPFAASLQNLERLGDFLDAVLERAINEACIMAALYSDDPSAHESINTNRDTADSGTSAADKKYDKLDYIEPSIVAHFMKEDKFEMMQPQTPSGRFDPFSKFMFRLIGLPGAIPLELSMLNFDATNFSGHRAAIEQAKRLWVQLQHLYAAEWTTPNYEWSCYEAMLTGDLSYREDWRAHEIRPNGWPYLQPKEDAEAAGERLRNGDATLTGILAEQGKGALERHLRMKGKEIRTAMRIGEEEGVDPEKLLPYLQDDFQAGNSGSSQNQGDNNAQS